MQTISKPILTIFYGAYLGTQIWEKMRRNSQLSASATVNSIAKGFQTVNQEATNAKEERLIRIVAKFVILMIR